MSILTNDEINDLSHPAARWKSVNACIMAAERLILEKLAAMELPGSVELSSSLDERPIYGYTADHLRQAYAQGAASQLLEKPTAWKYEQNGEWWVTDNWQEVEGDATGKVVSLYTRKELP